MSVNSRNIHFDELQRAIDGINSSHTGAVTTQLVSLGRRVHGLLSTLSLGGALVVDAQTISTLITDYQALALDCTDIVELLNYVRVRQLVRTINDAMSNYSSSDRYASNLLTLTLTLTQTLTLTPTTAAATGTRQTCEN